MSFTDTVMSQYKHLPIYKTSYDLLILITNKTKDYRNDFKYTLGFKMREDCMKLVQLIYKANSSTNKEPFIQDILDTVQIIELSSRLSKDLHLINTKAFSEIIPLTVSIEKQANGWLRSSTK